MSTIFDDRDQEISYNADHWALKSNAQELDGTDHFCNIVGGTATFKFDGPASVSVFGTIQSEKSPGRTTYSIDNGKPVTFAPAKPNNDQFQVKFFESAVSSGTHTLVISTLDFAPFLLDFIQVVPTDTPSPTSRTSTQSLTTTSPQFVHSFIPPDKPSSSSSSSSTQTQTITSSSSSPILGSTTSASSLSSGSSSLPSGVVTIFLTTTLPAPSTSTSSETRGPDTTLLYSSPIPRSHQTAKGVIVGSVLGSVIFVATLLGAIFYLLKRRRNWIVLDASLQQQAVSPFLLNDVETAPPRYSNVYNPEQPPIPLPKG